MTQPLTPRPRLPVGKMLAIFTVIAIGLVLYLWLAPRAPVVAVPPVGEVQP